MITDNYINCGQIRTIEAVWLISSTAPTQYKKIFSTSFTDDTKPELLF